MYVDRLYVNWKAGRKGKKIEDSLSPLCRVSTKAEGPICHRVSECSKLVQTQYKRKCDRVTTAGHWCLAKLKVPASNQWYQHWAESTVKNEKATLLWDFNIYTDHVIEARRPDIVLVMETKKCVTTNIVAPGDMRVKTTCANSLESCEGFDAQ